MDIHDEIKHLHKYEELTKQFDYSHSQANETPKPPAPKPSSPGINSKISNPIYWIGIMAVIFFYIILSRYASPIITLSIYIVALVLMNASISDLLKSGQKGLTKYDKYWMVMFMAFTPGIGQLVYYFRLREKMPVAAKVALWIGWRVLALFVVGIGIYTATTTLQSWQYQHGTSFQAGLNSVTGELNAITDAAKNQDGSAMLSHCQRLTSDITVLKSLPPHPDTLAQSKLDEALNELSKGATDCASAVKDASTERLSNANRELNDGYSVLRQAVQLIKSSRVF